MTATEYVANTARAFMAAEIATASANSAAANITRKLLDDYFARPVHRPYLSPAPYQK